MKNIFFLIFVSIFIMGCAPSSPKSYIKTSSPIFILQKPDSKTVFVSFQDSGNMENDIDSFVEKRLEDENFILTHNEEFASIIVKGTINYLRQKHLKNTRGFVSVGFGFGSGGRRYSDMGIGVEHRVFGGDDFADTYGHGYRYDGQASLLIRIKSKQKYENYSNNLDFVSKEGAYTLEHMTKEFNRQIANKIVEYLRF